MTAVTISFTVRVIFVDNYFGIFRKTFICQLHASANDLLSCAIKPDGFTGIATLRCADLWVRVIYVIASPIGEHGVNKLALVFGKKVVIK